MSDWFHARSGPTRKREIVWAHWFQPGKVGVTWWDVAARHVVSGGDVWVHDGRHDV